MTITVRATFHVRTRSSEDFVLITRGLADAARVETGTLRYGWFESEDPDEYVVLEAYADASAALAHNDQCSALLARVPEVAEMTSVHVHGVLGPELDAWVASHLLAHAHPPMPHLQPDTD